MNEQLMKEIAKISSNVSNASILSMGMEAENTMRAIRGESPAYIMSNFESLIEYYRIDPKVIAERLNAC